MYPDRADPHQEPLRQSPRHRSLQEETKPHKGEACEFSRLPAEC